jgi:hypothetical protein
MEAFKLEGTSMRPLFKAGETVLVAPFILHPLSFVLHRGDCAVYEFEGQKLMHRAVHVTGEGVWFADDAGCIEPHQVPWSAVRGKVLSRNPFASGLPGFLYSRARTLAAKLLCNLRKEKG